MTVLWSLLILVCFAVICVAFVTDIDNAIHEQILDQLWDEDE